MIILSALQCFSHKRLKTVRTLYCLLTEGFPNVKRAPCIWTRKGVIDNQFNLISICDRISNMGEAINVLPFNDNFPFQI